MKENSKTPKKTVQGISWIEVVGKYNFPDRGKSIWQLINSFVPYIILWALMIMSLKYSYWITIALMIPAAGFLVRIFIIFHDCGHQSFFKSKRWNDVIGIIGGVLTFSPYHKWAHGHSEHHKTVGDLDRRGSGDIWTLTVEEYKNLTPRRRFIYRLFRNPWFLLGVGSWLSFLFIQRFTRKDFTKKDRISVYYTNLGLIIIGVIAYFTIGLKAYLLIQLPVMFLAGMGGVWLFYVQHQYEDVIWCRSDEWDYKTMAMKGSSFYKLPRVLQWFSGNIGFHHIHHLSPLIPNYKLEKCHNENPIFQEIKPVTLKGSAKSLHLRLWDEEVKKIIRYREIRTS
jgi:omega-6 fatty acid desaturase (delta-12 desaturase)